MIRILFVIFSLSGIFTLCLGCTSVNKGLDEANKGAKEVGKPAGKVMQIPMSATEGVAEGIAGEKDKNPYGR